jgi:hypothetical protein
MKIKSILALGLLSLGLTSLVNAQTTNYVYITGSTAFRPAAFTAILNLMTNDSSRTVSAWSCASATDPTGGGNQQVSGVIGGANYVITMKWSGSEAGISDITGNGTQAFMALGATPGTNTATYAGATTAHVVNLAFADNLQSFSKKTTPTATGNRVGIIPFVFVKNAQTNAPADYLAITNVPDAAFRAALKVGGVKVCQFTGNPADTNRYVYISGRDNDSGTRVNTFADTSFGIKSGANQVTIGGSDNNFTLTPTSLTGGQSSGGTLAKSMFILGSAASAAGTNCIFGSTNGFYAIAYLGMYDADVATNGPANNGVNGAVILSYNGVPESTQAIAEGQYNFWGYEYLYQSISNIGDAGSIYTSLTQSNSAAITAACDGIHTIPLSTMNCTRLNNNPTADPVHN